MPWQEFVLWMIGLAAVVMGLMSVWAMLSEQTRAADERRSRGLRHQDEPDDD